MSIINEYATTNIRNASVNIDFTKLDATAGYLRHYANLLTLDFFYMHGTRAEKQQAAIEITICERKLKWWSNLPQFDMQKAAQGTAALKCQWKVAA